MDINMKMKNPVDNNLVRWDENRFFSKIINMIKNDKISISVNHKYLMRYFDSVIDIKNNHYKTVHLIFITDNLPKIKQIEILKH